MPAPYPQEFRDDVVCVARNREPGQKLSVIAKDFGISESCLTNWMRQADVEDGARPGKTREESSELCDARKRIRLLEQENEVLRRAAAYLSQANLPERLYPLVSELAADGVPVAVSLRVLKLSRQPYYRWRKQQVTESELVEAYRANALFDAHRDDPEFGYRFLAGEAEAAGESMCERTAWRICRDNQWWSVFGKKRGKNGKRPGPPVHDDLIKRDFTADDVNEIWLTDIPPLRAPRMIAAGGAPSEHWTDEGKLYLCAIKDVFSGRIVGYSISDRMKARLAVNALNNAVTRRDAAGCIVHSDRGSQFRARSFVHALNRHHLIGSMGKVGAAGDNAAMESFFALLQKNVLDRKRCRTREDLRIAIITWIERTYHRRRRQARLGRLTPIEYETIMNPTVSLAA
ncbi:IS3 family transposase [Propionimicrobium sp. PCR01-08-3]|uniref:IS3 family transposase n=1 Tax=Propionimicrobium sp. PCR01-08-3 TaxID=3052086 RepID=UPI00255C62B4|nr:IS3 family transposase [Propionimicrobium sp. PCR01-08-3]WIY82889.1 IS3 family transposase [Propionimicrobium sp. PCR01-08-3]